MLSDLRDQPARLMFVFPESGALDEQLRVVVQGADVVSQALLTFGQPVNHLFARRGCFDARYAGAVPVQRAVTKSAAVVGVLHFADMADNLEDRALAACW